MAESPDVYEPGDRETVSDAVVRALADARGVDPVDMEIHLYDAIDPDALDALFDARGERTERRVAFTVGDHRVVVDGARNVYVTTRTEHADPATESTERFCGTASPLPTAFEL